VNSVYPTTYVDSRGSVETSIINDSQSLRMSVRAVEFVGRSFDTFSPVTDSGDALKQFTLSSGCLCDCTLEWSMPIEIDLRPQSSASNLDIRLELGKPASVGCEETHLSIRLRFEDKIICSRGTSGWFEDELLDVQNELPDGAYLKCCFGCNLSDYSIYGHGLFGSMLCFRGVKTEYLDVKDKYEYMDVMESFTEIVQETYVCPQFQIRTPGTGYRG
jgi:hypothetical protein